MRKLLLILYARAKQASPRQRTLSGIQLSRKQALALSQDRSKSRGGLWNAKEPNLFLRPERLLSISLQKVLSTAEHPVTIRAFDYKQCFRHCSTPAKHAKIIDDTMSNLDTMSKNHVDPSLSFISSCNSKGFWKHDKKTLKILHHENML